MPNPIPPLDGQLCFALYSATHAMNRVYKPLLDDLGLTYPQYIALVALWDRDDQTVGQLGAALHLDSNTLTPLFKRMEAAGLVTRSRDARDERQVRVALTEAGRAMSTRATHIAGCILAATGLSLPDLTDLRARIFALRDRLDAAVTPR